MSFYCTSEVFCSPIQVWLDHDLIFGMLAGSDLIIIVIQAAS